MLIVSCLFISGGSGNSGGGESGGGGGSGKSKLNCLSVEFPNSSTLSMLDWSNGCSSPNEFLSQETN